jgi:hypothetical protein
VGYHNVPVPNYNNLAPEDCEHIIELSARDNSCGTQSQIRIGAGLLDAGKALKMLQKPLNQLYHFGSTASSNKAISFVGNSSVTITEHYENALGVTFVPGTVYKVKKYKVTSTIPHIIPSHETIVASWARSSSSNVMEDIITTGELRPRERAVIRSINSSTCTMEGYVYEVLDTSNNFVGWLPFDVNSFQSAANFEYSVLTTKMTNAQEINLDDTSISLYPNPANDIQQIKVLATGEKNLTITLLDVQGRKLKEVFKGLLSDGETLIENNVETLSNGFYIYEIKLDKNSSYTKFIKQ